MRCKACETGTMTDTDKQLLKAFEMKCYRKLRKWLTARSKRDGLG